MIRFAEETDRASICRLWERCFPEEGGFNEYFFTHFFQAEQTLLLIEDDTLCAMLQMLPYYLSAGDCVGEITYIYGACTAPECRRRGYMAKLLEHSFALDQLAGRMASVLIPQEEWLFDFYRPFGYEAAFFWNRVRVMAQTEKTDVLRPLTGADIPALERLYTRNVIGTHVVRDKTFWQQQIRMFSAIGGGAAGLERNGVLQGYAFCWENLVQEAVGFSERELPALAHFLQADAVTVCMPGSAMANGCAKWYDGESHPMGYLNLMLN